MLVHFNLTFQMIKVQHQPTFLLAHHPAENKMLIDEGKNSQLPAAFMFQDKTDRSVM